MSNHPFKKVSSLLLKIHQSTVVLYKYIIYISSPQIEKDLCSASAGFEDFVLQFLDR